MAFKTAFALFSICTFPSLTHGTPQVFQPLLVSFDDMFDSKRFDKTHDSIQDALSSDGILEVTGIPGFQTLHEETLQKAHLCMKQSPKKQSVTLPDLTVRHTLAGGSSATQGLEMIKHGSNTESCKEFDHASLAFRKKVADVVELFTKRLNTAFGLDRSMHFLRKTSSSAYDSLEEFVNAGDRLEHFHSYAKSDIKSGSVPAMDFHVDQGIFIAFAPALVMLDKTVLDKPSNSGDFMIRSQQGHELQVKFRQGSLVFMMGDGVNQYLNDDHVGLKLYAPAHAVRMNRNAPGVHRLWYGMMQLPPASAVSRETGLTFGQVRSEIIHAPQTALGCSRKLQARELLSTCSSNQIYCWHRCMDFTATASPTACAAQNSGFNCTDQFDQIYVAGHGDFHPSCTNSTSFVTPRPVVQQPNVTCTGWAQLVADPAYTDQVVLVPGETHLLWRVQGDHVKMKMIHNGLVGWMSVGLQNVGGKHNGMNGGQVVMGLNDPVLGLSIGERKIHDQSSAFRTWKTPLAPSALQDASMTVTNCFSMISFKTKTIYGKALNITSGMNRLIWALTHRDYPTAQFGGYAGHHSAADRDRNTRWKFRGQVNVSFINASGNSGNPSQADPSISNAETSKKLLAVIIVAIVVCPVAAFM